MKPFDFSILSDEKELLTYAKAEEMVMDVTNKTVSETSTFIKSSFDEHDFPYIFQMIIYASSVRPHAWNTLAKLWKAIGKPQIRFDFSLFTAFLASKGILDSSLLATEQVQQKYIQEAQESMKLNTSSLENLFIDDDVDKLKSLKNPEFTENISLISFAALNGAFNCFVELQNQGNTLSDDTLQCIIKGGNFKLVERFGKEIVENMKDLLPLSIQYHRHKITKYIIENALKLNKKPSSCIASLFTCMQSFNTLALVYMVKNGANVNEKKAVYPHISLLQSLTNKKFFVHAKFILKNSAKNMAIATNILETSMQTNDIEAIRFFIKNGKFDCNKLILTACSKGQLNIVKLLKEDGNADVTEEVVMKAISSGSLQTYSYVSKIYTSFDRNKAVLTAIQFGRANMIPYLMNQQTTQINDFLIAAVSAEQREITEQLLGMEADPNTINKNGDSVLLIAVKKNNNEIIQILLQAGADVNFATKNDGRTPLLQAAKGSPSKIVQFLLRRGAKVNQASKDGTTPLMEAAENNKLENINIIMQWGPVMNKLKNDTGMNALMLASMKGNTEVVTYLCNNHALVNFQSKDGKTPIFYAAIGGHTETMKALLDKGASLNIVDGLGYTPLWYTRINSKTEALQFLVENGADINHRAPDGRNILMQLEKDDRSAETATKYLISKGADVNAVDKYGNTPLLIAARTQRQFIVRYLVDAGANKDVTDKKGFTPLMIAAYDGEMGTAKYLIRKGCNLTLKSVRGMTALDYAKARGHDDLADVIQAAMEKQQSN